MKNPELIKEFVEFIAEMEKWRGKWANDDNEDSMPWDKKGLEGVPQNSQYESSIKVAREAVAIGRSLPHPRGLNLEQRENELIQQFETFVTEMITWRAKWTEDYLCNGDPLTHAIPKANKVVIQARQK